MLHVVHCVDTEGPLVESLEETFARVAAIYGVEMAPTAENLERIQRGEIDFGSASRTAAAAVTFAPDQLAFVTDWDAMGAMLDRLDHTAVRDHLPDSSGRGWYVNWHCLAHHGFDPALNPRRRALGVHTIFDYYRSRYANSASDGIHWHFHPIPISRQVNHCATSYFNNPTLLEIISRRILERQWFPCVNRPGCHAERPDSHWFLEQWMPFDVANLRATGDTTQPDLAGGRWGDWRRAPQDWEVYHPSHDDYQARGTCRRAIARCLNLDGRFARLTRDEIRRAFSRASREPTIMAFTNHDFRDIVPGVRFVQQELAEAAQAFPDVSWAYSDAATAMRECLGIGDEPHARFQLAMETNSAGGHRLGIELDRTPFGPQPWFCMELTDGSVHTDNLDWDTRPRAWHYTFDHHTVPLHGVRRIGLATNTASGRTSVAVYDVATRTLVETFHN